ncbi:MAG: hypothetical protein HYY16_02630 [Planctomycetes bacterium]|nr:hypothetical protein [Planctomycetota bacterium]
MVSIEEVLSKLSIKGFLVAKKLYAARQSVMGRVENLSTKLGQARGVLQRLDRKLARTIRRASGAPRRRATQRKARRSPRPGSLRSHLIETLRKTGSATARELATLVLKTGYKTESQFKVFLRAVHQALKINKDFVKAGEGKYALRK